MSEWNSMSEWKRQVLKRCADDFFFFKSVIENGLLKTISTDGCPIVPYSMNPGKQYHRVG